MRNDIKDILSQFYIFSTLSSVSTLSKRNPGTSLDNTLLMIDWNHENKKIMYLMEEVEILLQPPRLKTRSSGQPSAKDVIPRSVTFNCFVSGPALCILQPWWNAFQHISELRWAWRSSMYKFVTLFNQQVHHSTHANYNTEMNAIVVDMPIFAN